MANKPIGTLGTVDSITVGGVVFTDLTNLIVLHGGIQGANTNATLRKASAAGYQVTAGKTYTIRAVDISFSGATASDNTSLLYSDNDMGVPGTTAPTNAVYYGTFSSTQSQGMAAIFNGGNMGNATATGTAQRALSFPVPATKYVGVKSPASIGGDASIQTYGYET